MRGVANWEKKKDQLEMVPLCPLWIVCSRESYTLYPELQPFTSSGISWYSYILLIADTAGSQKHMGHILFFGGFQRFEKSLWKLAWCWYYFLIEGGGEGGSPGENCRSGNSWLPIFSRLSRSMGYHKSWNWLSGERGATNSFFHAKVLLISPPSYDKIFLRIHCKM